LRNIALKMKNDYVVNRIVSSEIAASNNAHICWTDSWHNFVIAEITSNLQVTEQRIRLMQHTNITSVISSKLQTQKTFPLVYSHISKITFVRRLKENSHLYIQVHITVQIMLCSAVIHSNIRKIRESLFNKCNFN